MNFTACLVCQSAQVYNGLLCVLGGGVTRVNITPQRLADALAKAEESGLTPAGQLTVAISGQISADDTRLIHEIVIAIKRPNTTEEIGRAVVAIQLGDTSRLHPGEPANFAVVAPFPVPIIDAGPLDITVSGDRDAGSITQTIYVEHIQV